MEASATAVEPHRILVVDDEPNIADVVSMALRFQGFAVETAGTGGDALAAVRDFDPHLLVLDIMLPDMEGFDVAERLGAQRAQLPIIFLTARDSTQDKIRGLTSGGDDYVTKPFSLEELVARIRDPAPHRRAGADVVAAHVRGPRAGRGHARRHARGAADRADSNRVPPLALPAAQPAPRAHARAAARPCLGVRLRRRLADPRDVCQLPAQEA
jgi:DNA-binding response OmpR family regulator